MRNIFKKMMLLLISAASMICFPVMAFAAEKPIISISVNTDTTKDIAPRQKVVYEVDINNEGGASWLRIKFNTESKGITEKFDTGCFSFSSNWEKIGDYWYYTKKAEKGETVSVMDSFTVPDILKAEKGAKLSISATAEAIDTTFKPDFDSKNPWKGASSSSSASFSGGGTATGLHGYNGVVTVNGLTRYDKPNGGTSVSKGKWYLVDEQNHLWKYGNQEKNSYAADGWYLLNNDYSKSDDKNQWFYFDKNGYMAVGWLNPTGNDWYHLHEISDGDLGSLTKGFYDDPNDKRTYYLSQTDGLMQTGWQVIGGRYYYFAKASEIPAANWFYKTINGTSVGRWVYNALGLRTYGSLYRSEYTPDGFHVNAYGYWDGKQK